MPTETSPAATKRINEMSVTELRLALIDIHATLYATYLSDGREHDNATGDAIGECFACHGISSPLLSETNTEDVKTEIEEAFVQSDAYAHFNAMGGTTDGIDVFYEHGQWFVRVTGDEDVGDESTTTFSVVDAEPGVDGLDFEEL